jgi:hypothetical protein
MPRDLLRAVRAALLFVPLSACGEPLRLVLVEADSNLVQGGTGGSDSGGSDSGGMGAGGSGGQAGTAPDPVKECEQMARAARWDAPALYTVSYVSALYPGQYVRHVDSQVYIGPIDSMLAAEEEGASFEAIPGVWDCECISLRAVNLNSSLVRHAGSRVYVHPAADMDLYLADATFCPEPGLADPEGVSFRSVNYPQRMIHLRNQNELWIDDIVVSPPATPAQAALFADEVTFYREAALIER